MHLAARLKNALLERAARELHPHLPQTHDLAVHAAAINAIDERVEDLHARLTEITPSVVAEPDTGPSWG